MTKYYRPASVIFENSRFSKAVAKVLNYLCSLWTGREAYETPRPPLWVRRLMLITFPLSYLLLCGAFVILFIVFCVAGFASIFAIGIVNFYRRRWE